MAPAEFYIKIMDKVNHLVTWMLAVMLGLMSLAIFAQVIYRYILEAPLPWSEEMARYLMIWLVFLGAGLGVRAKALIGMEALVNILPRPVKSVSKELVLVFTVCFLMVVLYYGLRLTIMNAPQVSPAMQISMSWPYLAVPAGALLMLANVFVVALERWKGGSS